jgi:DNA-binding IclR family transcriptional regulator
MVESTVLTKAFGLLEAMADDAGDGKPLAALAASAGMAKPTAHRILRSLVALGYVQRPEAGVYRPGAKLRRLAGGGGAARDAAILAAAETPMGGLQKQSGETVNLAVLRGARVFYLRVLESTHALRWASDVHASDPFHCTALGRAIVAQLPVEQQTSLLNRAGPLKRPTPRTITDTKRLAQILAQARQDGFAVEREQSEIGGMCVAAPSFDRDNVVVAAVSITLPIARLHSAGGEDKLARLACKAARQISQRLSKQHQSKPF